MIKKITVAMLGVCMLSMPVTGVSAADFGDGTEVQGNLFTDGKNKDQTDSSDETQTEGISAVTESVVAYAKGKGKEYQDLKTQTNIAAERKASEKRARKAACIAAKTARIVETNRVQTRREVVDFALQFEGNPYVYGGTSLTKGADCSGFTMSVFKEFGCELPRVAAAQYEASRKKELSEIEPGDLVFYGRGGISHVALYIGNGKIIHASTSASGIKISDYDYETPVGVGSYLK